MFQLLDIKSLYTFLNSRFNINLVFPDLCFVSIDDLDRARTSDGTDEDLLFIYKNTFQGKTNQTFL